MEIYKEFVFTNQIGPGRFGGVLPFRGWAATERESRLVRVCEPDWCVFANQISVFCGWLDGVYGGGRVHHERGARHVW